METSKMIMEILMKNAPQKKMTIRETIKSLQDKNTLQEQELKKAHDRILKAEADMATLIDAAFGSSKEFSWHDDRTLKGAISKMDELRRFKQQTEGSINTHTRLLTDERDKLWEFIYATHGLGQNVKDVCGRD